MKVSSYIVSTLVLVTTWLSYSTADYRYKLRGPPGPPRQPAYPQYMQKWEKQRLTRGSPTRPRPISMLSPKFGQPPVGPPLRPTPPPKRPVWKNSKPLLRKIPEKQIPFHSSQQIGSSHEFDYHIQTNNIPNQLAFPIKQVGEKGPIHTIPAPNLSIADKPLVIQEVKQILPKLEGVTNNLQHQYQVTEVNDVPKLKDGSHKHVFGQSNAFPSAHSQISTIWPSDSAKFHNQQPGISQELLHFVNVHPQQQQQLGLEYGSSQAVAQTLNQQYQQQDGVQFGSQAVPQSLNQQYQQQEYGSQAIPQTLSQQYQQLPLSDYQTLVAQQQQQQPIFQPDASYLNQIQQMAIFHGNKEAQEQYNPYIFAQTEQKNVGHQDQFADPSQEPSEVIEAFAKDSNQQQNHQAPYVEEVYQYDRRPANNEVEDDEQISEKVQVQDEMQIDDTAIYTTLPNRQAAETLATLQAAGETNTRNSNQNRPLTIYVPDGGQSPDSNQAQVEQVVNANEEEIQVDGTQGEDNVFYAGGFSQNVDQEDGASENLETSVYTSFGSRIRPKKGN